MKTPGKDLGTPGNTWEHVKTSGNTWKDLETPVNAWKHVKTPGSSTWKHLEACENTRETPGSTWKHLETPCSVQLGGLSKWAPGKSPGREPSPWPVTARPLERRGRSRGSRRGAAAGRSRGVRSTSVRQTEGTTAKGEVAMDVAMTFSIVCVFFVGVLAVSE